MSGGEDPSQGEWMMELCRELYPICRSITGQGVRQTLQILQRQIPLEVHEVASGTSVLDWTVPDEWNIRDAWIKDTSGRRVVDFSQSNLHVVNYSEPVHRTMGLTELRQHLHSMPEHPERIPYRTSYYERTWGFCVSHELLESLDQPEYEVCIDSSLQPGHLSYGELLLPGREESEFLVTTHICHPSMGNDNLSGIAVATSLAKTLASHPARHAIRLLLIPGTIGAITWLARNRHHTHRIRGGLTLACLGDPGPLQYKKTVSGKQTIDRIAEAVLQDLDAPTAVQDFSPFGFDERQFNTPGFRLPVGGLRRGGQDMFDQCHSSADDLDFITAAQLQEASTAALQIVRRFDRNRRYCNRAPWGEPQLGRRGLYRALGGTDIDDGELAMLWVLNLSDGQNDLLDIADRSKLAFESIADAAELLVEHELLEELATPLQGTDS